MAPEAARTTARLDRSWSGRDAFIYAFFSVNLVTLGLYIISQAWHFEGGMIPALVLGAFLVLSEILVYAGFICAMPTAGGDYVWQSRVLGPGVGFILGITGWCFVLWLWTPLYADMLRQIVLTPLAAVLGRGSLAIAISSSRGIWFGCCLATCLFVFAVIALGMDAYAKVQRFCFWVGTAALLVVVGILLVEGGGGDVGAFRLRFDAGALSIFGLRDAYAAIDAAGAAAAASAATGHASGTTTPLWGGSLSQLFLLAPFLAFFNLWPNCGASLSGEVRGAQNFRRNLVVMAGALAAATALVIVVLVAIDRSMGWNFYMRANAAYWQGRLHPAAAGEGVPAMPFWPYPVLLALMTVASPALRVVVVLAMSAWFFGWAGTMYLSSTRILFSASFDRLLPGHLGDLDPRTKAPIKALTYMVLPGLLVSALYVWDAFGFSTLTLASTLVIAVTYFGTGIAAIALPFVRKELYRASPLAAFRLGKVPLISVFGLACCAFLGYLLFEWIVDPAGLYGISLRNGTSVGFLFVVYAAAGLLYVWRKKMKPTPNRNMDEIVVVAERQKVEYDRFGPWTYPVAGPDDMPPRFDAWYEELKSSALILKLPKAVERRTATPGSDLYEGLLAVGPGGVVYLSFSRGEVQRRGVAFRDVVAVALAQELLSGTLRLDLAGGGSLSIPFNTVSADVMGDFADKVRAACGSSAHGSAAEGTGAGGAGAVLATSRRFGRLESPLEPSEDDTLFQVLLRALRRQDPGFSVLAYQQPSILHSVREGGRRGLVWLVARVLRWRLDGCLLAAVPSELVLFFRGSGKVRSGTFRGYRYEVVYLAASVFMSAACVPRILPNGARIHALRIFASGHEYELLLEADPSKALAALG